jgi:hypothetical protein
MKDGKALHGRASRTRSLDLSGGLVVIAQHHNNGCDVSRDEHALLAAMLDHDADNFAPADLRSLKFPQWRTADPIGLRKIERFPVKVNDAPLGKWPR